MEIELSKNQDLLSFETLSLKVERLISSRIPPNCKLTRFQVLRDFLSMRICNIADWIRHGRAF